MPSSHCSGMKLGMKPKAYPNSPDRIPPREYYTLRAIATATGLSPTHLRACPLRKNRFGNADYLKVEQGNHYIEKPSRILLKAISGSLGSSCSVPHPLPHAGPSRYPYLPSNRSIREDILSLPYHTLSYTLLTFAAPILRSPSHFPGAYSHQ